MAEFVLIHGTTQGPDGWSRLRDSLDKLGHAAVFIDLAEIADGSAAEYAEVVRRQVETSVRSPIAVAHSGGGLVLPAAAHALGARHQVWVAAMVPDGRRSMLEEAQASATTTFNKEWLGKDPTRDPALATYFLFHDCDLETLQWALTTLRLFAPSSLYSERVPLSGEIPSTYVVCARDRTLRPDWSRRVAVSRLGAEVVELDSGHCPHVSQPQVLAQVLARIAKAAD